MVNALAMDPGDDSPSLARFMRRGIFEPPHGYESDAFRGLRHQIFIDRGFFGCGFWYSEPQKISGKLKCCFLRKIVQRKKFSAASEDVAAGNRFDRPETRKHH